MQRAEGRRSQKKAIVRSTDDRDGHKDDDDGSVGSKLRS